MYFHNHNPKKMANYKKLGFFICESGNLVVSDPCYGRKYLEHDERNVATILQGVLIGHYGAAVRRDWDTNQELIIWHLDSYDSQDVVTQQPWIQYSGENGENPNLEICVDSGQAGFFEESKYPQQIEDITFKSNTEGKSFFYGFACYITLETKWRAGIISTSPDNVMGVVSQTGDGDGRYTLYVQRDAFGNIIAARLIFLDETAEDDDDEDCANQ